jgi:biopolymer transport protein TolR
MAQYRPFSASAEPNVTPMIDVLLVLLIIFMTKVPDRRVVNAQLPEPTPATAQDAKQIVLEVGPDGTYWVNRQAVPGVDLERYLRNVYRERPDKRLLVRGDSLVSYQEVIVAMDIARGAGARVIGLMTK